MIGRVVSTKSKNTANVLVKRGAKHPLYRKTFVRSKKYLAADRIGVKMGDIVEIAKVRPISKRKHWQVVKVLGKSLAEIAEQQMKEKAEQIIAEVMPEEKVESSSQNQALSEETEKKPKSRKKGKTELSKK